MIAASSTTSMPYARARTLESSAWYLGQTLITFLATGDDTDGQFSLMEYRAPRGGEPPPHLHRGEDESFYILEGHITFRVGNQTFAGAAGDWVVVPRGAVHSCSIDTDEATALVLLTPAGFERFFQEASEPARSLTTPPEPTGPPDIPRLIAIAARYGCEFVAPDEARGPVT